MTESDERDTSYALPEVNALLRELLESVQTSLGSHFVGMYVDGSLASGDFDQDSDIDFVVIADDEITGDFFMALQAMHDRIATMDSPWAIQLEGSYMSRRALARHDPTCTLHPNIERGRGERLKMVHHDEAWDVHRIVLRERGITLAGPAARDLIDPVPPARLRQAMRILMSRWATQILHEPAPLRQRGYQSYMVLSMCRVLYTLQHGAVASKAVAARWAQATQGQRWAPLIEGAWAGRHEPDTEASSEDIHETLEFIRYTLEHGRQFEKLADQGCGFYRHGADGL